MRKVWLAALVLVVALLVGAYFGSAYYAAGNLKSAALSGNADTIEAAVDFPAVRESLKSQLSAALTKSMAEDPKVKDNPFAALGMMFAPAIIDKMVDAFLTPQGIAALVNGRKPGKPATGSSEEKPDIATSSEWVSVDRFRVRTRDKRTGKVGPSLLFERRGPVSWKLIRIELPDTMLKLGS